MRLFTTHSQSPEAIFAHVAGPKTVIPSNPTDVPAYPDINATFDEEAGILRRHAAVHIGVAAHTERGLVVPVVRHVERRDLWDCAREIARVAGSARSGNATREDLSGSTLTLTSPGPLGGMAATPVINYPEVAVPVPIASSSARPCGQAPSSYAR